MISPVTLKYKSREYEGKYQSDSKRIILSQMKIGLPIGILIYCSFLPIDYLVFNEKFTLFLWNRIVVGCLALLIYVFINAGFVKEKANSLILSLFVIVTLGTIHLGSVESVYYLSVLSPLLFFNLLIRGRFLIHGVTTLILFIIFASVYMLQLPEFGLRTILYPAIFFATALVTLMAAYFREYTNRNEYWQHLLLEKEKEVSNRLLLNILPEKIAALLKRGRKTIAGEYKSVSVVFIDIVNFSEISRNNASEYVVEKLNSLFKIIDRLCGYYHIEKIKTIGDAYLAVCGAPTANNRHAHQMAKFTLSILDNLDAIRKKSFPDISLRIGLHCGSAMGGVLGKKKFIFDIWGDTVNIASRMESTGEANKIHVTAPFRDLICDEFILERRGEIEIKGYDAIDSFFLIGKKSKKTRLMLFKD